MIDYEVTDGIAVITWNMTDSGANVLHDQSRTAFGEAFEQALADDMVTGIIVTSAKRDFLAGADLTKFLQPREAAEMADWVMRAQQTYRRVETGGKPVVAAINGHALGGGYELCLSCHHRIVADDERIRLGLPEVTLGLLPGAGGTQRLPRLIGLKKALPLLLEGKRLSPQKALAVGMVDQVVPREQLLGAARAWLGSEAAAERPWPGNPWDRKGFRPPGGDLRGFENQQVMTGANAQVGARTAGNYPAPVAILRSVHDGFSTTLDAALRMEAKYFGATATSPQARAMVRSLFFSMGEANKIKGRPAGVEKRTPAKVGIIGAGLMGQGIGHVSAVAGLAVVLLDTDPGRLLAAIDRSKSLLDREVARGRMTESRLEEIMAHLHTTDRYEDLADCDLVIEAVFEDRAVKAEVTAKAAAVMKPDAIFASNTSTLPITTLAEAFPRPERFLGLHFFSPVHRMKLVEVIKGKHTDETCLAWALDYCQAIAKTPIVVNDSRGFFTSRVVSSYLAEGISLLAEGVNPALIENAGRQAGMPLGPLALADEVQLLLMYRIRKQWIADLGDAYQPGVEFQVVSRFVEALDRPGKAAGKGFYDYADDGERRLWPGLAGEFPLAAGQPDVETVKRRLLYIQSLESARALEQQVVTRPADADVGSLLGWGFPSWSGGVLSLIDQVGSGEFVARCQALADALGSEGERFVPPQGLSEMAARGESYYQAPS